MLKLALTLACAVIVLLPYAPACAKEAAAPARIAIIIDDIGNSEALGRRALDVPGELTYAILPFTANSRRLAVYAQQLNKEVMLHMPMSNVLSVAPGPGTITPDMGREEMLTALRAALDHLPEAVGVNNHMGSELTQFYNAMAWLMEEIHARQLYFIDSRTTPHSEALQAARHAHIDSRSRDVFLDNEPNEAAIARQFEELLATARRRGQAVGIGHPHPATIRYLNKRLPRLAAENIELVPVSRLLNREHFAQAAGAAQAGGASSKLSARSSED